MAATVTTASLQSTFRTTQHSETMLVESARAGSAEAFTELVMNCRKKLFGFALRLTGNAQDAEDVVQEATLKAFRRFKNFKAESRFDTWLTTITKNEALMLLRKKKGSVASIESFSREGDDGTIVSWEIPDDRRTAFEVMENSEKGAVIVKAIQGLVPVLRATVICRYVYGMSIQETSVYFGGASEGTVKNRAYRGRMQIREALLRTLGDRSNKKK